MQLPHWRCAVTYPDGTWSSYSYDPMGNRTELGTQAGTTGYSYDRSDRLLSTSGANPLSFSWDGRGNETAKGSATFGYDSANRLISANTGTASTYSYNGEGVRIGKTVGGTTTTYLQDTVGGLHRGLVRINLAELYVRLDRHADAISEYEEAVALAPDDPRLRTRLEELRRTGDQATPAWARLRLCRMLVSRECVARAAPPR